MKANAHSKEQRRDFTIVQKRMTEKVFKSKKTYSRNMKYKTKPTHDEQD